MDDYRRHLDSSATVLYAAAAAAAIFGQGVAAALLTAQAVTIDSYASNAQSTYNKQCVEEKNRLIDGWGPDR